MNQPLDYPVTIDPNSLTHAYVTWTEWSYFICRYETEWSKRIAITHEKLNEITNFEIWNIEVSEVQAKISGILFDNISHTNLIPNK